MKYGDRFYKEGFVTYRCLTCSESLNSELELKEHLQSLEHKKRDMELSKERQEQADTIPTKWWVELREYVEKDRQWWGEFREAGVFPHPSYEERFLSCAIVLKLMDAIEQRGKDE